MKFQKFSVTLIVVRRVAGALSRPPLRIGQVRIPGDRKARIRTEAAELQGNSALRAVRQRG
jgi:hypothetical protein